MQIPSPARVASRFRAASSVKVEVLDEATEKARKRFGQGIAIGRFKSPIKLYRVFDGEELREILDTGEIKGGDYSVAAERAFGAQWGSDRTEVAKWGEGQRGKRLGHELFLAEIDGNGRVFSHLSGAGDQMQPGAGTLDLDPSFCSTGLGCSIPITTNAVNSWYIVEGGSPRKVSKAELEAVQGEVGLKARDIDLFKGARLTGLPKRLQQAVLWEILQEDQEFRKARYNDDWPTQRTMMQEAGLGPRDSMDKVKMGQLLFRHMCKEIGSDECGTWGTSSSKAEAEAGKNSGPKSFPTVIALMAHASATFRQVDVTGLEGTKVKYVDVRAPSGHWVRIWQPWGDTAVQILADGSVVFR